MTQRPDQPCTHQVELLYYRSRSGLTMLFLDATLTPNRSLNPRTVNLVIAGVFCVSLLASAYFLQLGAFPVVGFFGLDALGLWFAFRWNMKRQSQRTNIKIDNENIYLQHFDGYGNEKRAQMPTAFTRVELAQQSAYDSQLSLSYGQRVLIIGQFLTRDEKAEFTDVLKASLLRARAFRYPAK